MIVPNQFPTSYTTNKIAIIGESPGADEDRLGIPFMGYSGQLLDKLLSRAGVSRSQVFVGNICQHRPLNNDLSTFGWNSNFVQEGLTALKRDLDQFKPNVILLLGNWALKAAKNDGSAVSNWRGSVFKCAEPDSPFLGMKVLSSYHPAYCLRSFDDMPFLMMDIRRTAKQSLFPEVRMLPRNVIVPKFADGAIQNLGAFSVLKIKTAYDIEGYWNNLKCIGFSNHRELALVIPFKRQNGSRYWSKEDEPRVWRAVARLLEDASVPKIAQAGLYDRFCLHYGQYIRVAGTTDDTMSKHWSLYSELARDDKKKKGRKGMGLAIQASIYTDIPYYKDGYDADTDEGFWRYCGLDCMATKEIDGCIEDIWNGPGDPLTFTKDEFQSMRRLYNHVIEITSGFLYMELKGIRYDEATAATRVKDLERKMHETQAKVNYLTGHGFKWKTKDELNQCVRNLMMTKKGDRPYKQYEETLTQFRTLVAQASPNLATIGEIESLCEVSLNLESPKQSNKFFYETLMLPVQTKEDVNGVQRPTSDYEALLKLSRICAQDKEKQFVLPILNCAIELRSLSTRISMLRISADRDKRIRCGYNVVGSNTGRVTCYESPTGSGYNLQTIPNYTDKSSAPGGVLGDRDLFLADEGWWLFQCDLKGADGWTVAAYSAMLGDATMLNDYKNGISPFERLTLKLLGKPIPTDLSELKATIKEFVEKDGWPRFACKRVQHGGCYLEGAITVSRNILKDSEGKLVLAPKECQALLDYSFQLYWGIKRWHDYISRRIQARQVLTAASGQVRQFFGRPDEILTKAVAFEPQANTTYATNLAMHKLWTDPDNRQSTKHLHDSSRETTLLKIQPLHSVHDALIGQFAQYDTSWAVGKIASYFNNPLKIAGQDITIPFDGGFGRSWGQLGPKHGGGIISSGPQLNLIPQTQNK